MSTKKLSEMLSIEKLKTFTAFQKLCKNVANLSEKKLPLCPNSNKSPNLVTLVVVSENDNRDSKRGEEQSTHFVLSSQSTMN